MVLGWLRIGDLAESGSDTDSRSVSMVVGEMRQAAVDLSGVVSLSGLMRWMRSSTRLLGDERLGKQVWCDWWWLDGGIGVIWI